MSKLQYQIIAVAMLSWGASVAAQQEAGSQPVTIYPATFFANAQPYSAFDMLPLLPGYKFSEGDAEVRGFAGAAGNILIDGSRPVGKHETLETLLRRIPAGAVERIELIRAGAPGIDMQGQTLLANIVRANETQTRGSTELSSGFYQRGLSSPRAAVEFSRQTGDSLLELSGARYRTVDDEHGAGTRPRISPDGEMLRDSRYVEDERDDVTEMAAGYRRNVGKGKLQLNASLQQLDFAADILDARTLPVLNDVAVTEFSDERDAEFGLHYDRPFAARSQFELFGIQHNTRIRGGERGFELGETSIVREDSDASESILRGIVRRTGDRLTLEGGLEGALNVLDSHSSLNENGSDIPLPAASVRVEERRAEAFMTATWKIDPRWLLETGSRFESTELTQSGDSSLSKTFFFAKPRVLLSWSPRPEDRLRLLLERQVGQLDFEDFVSSTSLSSNTVTAGNPDLEPDRTWRTELAWEMHFMRGAALVLAARHDDIDNLVDRIPVQGGEPFDGVGNIGRGERNEFEINLTLPLDWLGISAGLWKVDAQWSDGRATDPASGESRRISGDTPVEAAMHFTQELAQWQARWGVDVEFASETSEYRFDEVRTDRLGTMVNLFAEYQPAPAWNLRFYANNLTDRSAERERRIYDGVRGSSELAYVETRTLKIGPYVGVAVRRAFGN